MKKIRILHIAMYVLAVVSFTGCNPEDERVTFNGPYYVQFTSSSAAISEAAGTVVAIQVSNVGPTLDEDITISYSTTGSTAVLDVDYELEAGQVAGQITIPAGRHFGELRIIPIDNDESDGTRTLTLTLTSASSNLQAGFGAIGVSSSVSITDNDCPLDLETFPGSYDHSFTHTAGFLWAAGTQTGFVATLGTTGTENIFSCTNFFGIVDRFGLGALPGEPGLIPIQINVEAKTAQVQDGAWILYGTSAPREIQGRGAGDVATCGPNFTMAADLVRTNEQTVGTSILVASFEKLN